MSYDAAGIERWVKSKNGATNGDDIAKVVATDAAGNVYVAGTSNSDVLTVSYDSAGNERWAKVRDAVSGSQDSVYAIAVDAAGNVYLAGCADSGPSASLLIISYDSAGNERWVKTKSAATSTQANNDRDAAIGVDASGNVYVAGSAWNGTNSDFLIVTYDTNGTELWSRTKNSTANLDDVAHALAVDASANVFVTGYTRNDSTLTVLTTRTATNAGATRKTASPTASPSTVPRMCTSPARRRSIS